MVVSFVLCLSHREYTRCWYSIVAPRMDYGLEGYWIRCPNSSRKAGYALFESFEKFEFWWFYCLVVVSSCNTTEGAIGVTYYARTSCVVRNNWTLFWFVIFFVRRRFSSALFFFRRLIEPKGSQCAACVRTLTAGEWGEKKHKADRIVACKK